jgi:hypothetical protein
MCRASNLRQDADEIDGQHRGELVLGVLPERAVGAGDAGVVVRDVEPAEGVHRRRDHPLYLVGVAHVRRDRHDPATRGAGERCETRLVDVRRHDPRSRGGEGERAGSADTGCGTRDQDAHAGEVGHVSGLCPAASGVTPDPRPPEWRDT